MSKSYGNYIGITDQPSEMFGKVMSISDDLMWRYYELLSYKPMSAVKKLRDEVLAGKNPRDVKVLLAEELVARFHCQDDAKKAHQEFVERFRNNQLPDDLPEKELICTDAQMGIAHILKASGLVASTSEAIRMIKQGAVRIDGERVADSRLEVAGGKSHLYQVGKRKFAKVLIKCE